LLSDTHVCHPEHRPYIRLLSTPKLPPQIKDAFRGVDMILHAGDIYMLSVLDELEQIAPVFAAEGDDDPVEATNDKRVKSKHTLTVEGVTIWLAHEYQWFGYGKLPDVLVYGHAHQASLDNYEGAIRINPGSPTFPNYQRRPGTLGLLTITAGKAEAKIIQL
jgi:putative phosphoesterase